MNNKNKLGIVQGRLTQCPPGCLQWFPKIIGERNLE